MTNKSEEFKVACARTPAQVYEEHVDEVREESTELASVEKELVEQIDDYLYKTLEPFAVPIVKEGIERGRYLSAQVGRSMMHWAVLKQASLSRNVRRDCSATGRKSRLRFTRSWPMCWRTSQEAWNVESAVSQQEEK